MRRRDFVLANAVALVLPRAAWAQKKTPVIGLLWADSVKPSRNAAIFLQAMRDKGYVAGRDFRLDDQVTLEGYEGFAESAAQLVRSKVDIIVSSGTTATMAAAKATKEIPIVALIGSDPVARGLAASLSRPGGNVTGIASLTVDLTRKRIAVLKETVPGLSKVGVVLATNVANPINMREAQEATRALALEVQFVEVAAPTDFESRIAELAQARVNGIYVAPSSLVGAHSSRLVAAIGSHRLPALYSNDRFEEAGGLVVYSANVGKGFVRMAAYVDRILRGARPGDLPIEQTTDFDLVINLKTAKTLGIAIPHSVRMRADRVIE